MSEDKDKDDLVEGMLQLSERAFRELIPMVPKEWLQLDLTMPQLKVALLLFMNGPCRMSKIASSLGVSLATATGVVDRLVERGFVAREDDPDDRRVVLCHLSEGGHGLVSGLWELARDRAGELLHAIPVEQLDMLRQGLDALVKAGDATRTESETA